MKRLDLWVSSTLSVQGLGTDTHTLHSIPAADLVARAFSYEDIVDEMILRELGVQVESRYVGCGEYRFPHVKWTGH